MKSREYDPLQPPSPGDPTNGSASRHAEGESAPRLHALLVGIEHYLGSALYDNLQGCITDVREMERYLTEVLGVAAERVETLTATNGGEELPPEPRESWPTYENLVSALERLARRCRRGDHALFHYSGQGGRTPTVYRELKGPVAQDECLVPLDIARPEARYLRDAEIAVWIRRLIEKGVFVTLVMDCCHSGGIRRDVEPAVRGGRRIDRTPRTVTSLLATPEELAALYGGKADPGRPRAAWNGGMSRENDTELRADGRRAPRARTYRHAQMVPGVRPTAEGFALLAACQPHERAREFPFDGVRPAGALTHFLLRALQQMGPEATYGQLHRAVVEGVHSRFRSQTPLFEGEIRALPLGHRELPRRWGLEVLAAEEGEEPSRIRLAAGRAQGVAEGARFALYPLAQSATQSAMEGPGTPHAVARVTKAEVAVCEAEVEEGEGRRLPIRPGDRAVLVDPGPEVLARRVRLVEPEGGPGAELCAEVERRLEQRVNPRLREADRARVDFQVLVPAEGRVSICDAAGQELPHLVPVRAEDRQAADRLWCLLEHLARYETVRGLDNTDCSSSLFAAVGLRVDRHSEERSRPEGGRDDSGCPERRSGSYPLEIVVGERIRVTIVNRSYRPVHAVVLDLRPDWEISQIVPSVAGSTLLEANSSRELVFDSYLPAGLEGGTEVLKVFGSTAPLDVRWLELPPLAEVVRGEHKVAWRSGAVPLARSSAETSPESRVESSVANPAPMCGALGHLQAVEVNGAPALRLRSFAGDSRSSASSSAEAQDWTTAQVELRIVARGD